jgi:mono/diheme cytochrome c family protein
MKLKLTMCLTGAAATAAAMLLMVPTQSVHAQATGSAPQTKKPGLEKAAPLPASLAVERGRYIANASDCIACHTAPKSKAPFAGGYPLDTPFGKIIATNITPDRATGIGSWSERDFERAVRKGKRKDGANLYPAMPYTAYAKLSDADMHDLWLYMQTVKPVRSEVAATSLPFPFNIRLLVSGWNLLFFDNAPYQVDAHESAEWNRGAYLVLGAGHCASCHTAKNFLGGDKESFLQGGVLAGWYAPEITGNPYTGVGSWSQAQLVQYLKIGSNDVAVASGPMAEAVTNSTQHMSEQDLKAIATYLKSQGGSSLAKPAAIAGNDKQMVRGKHVYEVNCVACHDFSGKGVGTMVAALANSAGLQSPHADSLLRTVLVGDRGAVTTGNPTGAAMPSFAWKLSNDDIAAVLTYARNSWGNAAPAVTPDDVRRARSELKAPAQLAAGAPQSR